MSYTARLARFVIETRFDDLPEKVVEKAKHLILDTVAASFGGIHTDIGGILKSLFQELGGKPECTVVGSSQKTSCAHAAWINSKLGNALDVDDVFFNFSHFAPISLYPALALAEREGRSGKDLITSVVLGYDLAARVRVSALGRSRGQTWTVVAGIVSAGKMMQLGQEELLNALGIGCAFAPVPASRKSLGPPVTMVKYSDMGLAGFLGVISCLMAKKGYTGSQDIFDGDYGFWKLLGADLCAYDLMVDGLGKRWYIMESAFKPYPCCRWIHIPLDLLRSLIDREKLHRSEIHSVIVRVHPDAASLTTNNPKDGVGAQFSIPYNIALAAFGVPPGPQWQSIDLMHNEEITNFAQKVKVEVEPESVEILNSDSQPTFGFTRSAAAIEVEARGRKFVERGNWAKGDPWQSEYVMSYKELENKFKVYASSLAPLSDIWNKQTERLGSMINSLERVQDIQEMTKLLCPANKSLSGGP